VIFSVVKQRFQAFLRRQPHMMAAIAADVQVVFEVPMEKHLLAGRALQPEIFRNIGLRANQRPDLRSYVVIQPVHEAFPFRADLTASASCDT
jgi:hypothetical protein